MAGALIVTAELAPRDLAWLDGLRRRHYPPERNRLPAHLTMFHALPPSSELELRSRLAAMARGPAPRATAAGLMDLGGGTAIRIQSEELSVLREALADGLHGLLSAQDAHGWAPHVTIQNKVSNREARELRAALEPGFAPRPVAIGGLALHRYLGGPWDTLSRWSFRGA